MPFGITGALIGGIGSIFGASTQADAAKTAAADQLQASQAALAQQQQQWQTAQNNSAPFVAAGQQSVGQLMSGLSNGTFGVGSTPSTPTYSGTAITPSSYVAPTGAPGTYSLPSSMADLEATPGYQFTQQQGQRGIEAAAAATGSLQSGGALKSLDSFNTGLASQTYQNAVANSEGAYNENLQGFNANVGANSQQFSSDLTGQEAGFNSGLSAYQQQLAQYNAQLSGQTQQYNELAGVAGTGQTAANSINSTGTQVANSVGNLMTGVGNAQAASAIGQSNAITGGINGLTGGINSALNNYQMSKVLSPTSFSQPDASSFPTQSLTAGNNFDANTLGAGVDDYGG